MAEIYIVDDDAAVRQVLVRLFEAAGHTVRSFATAADFLAGYRAATDQCLVLDICLPGMSGPELHDRLLEAAVDLPIIMITGNSGITTVVQALHRGVLDVLEKPFHPATLLERVQSALARQRIVRARRCERATLESSLDALTAREREVLELLVHGGTSKGIAARWGVSPRTIDVHRARILHKMGMDSMVDLVRRLVQCEIPWACHPPLPMPVQAPHPAAHTEFAYTEPPHTDRFHT